MSPEPNTVVGQTLSKVTRVFRGGLVVFVLGLIVSVLWSRSLGPESPEWLSAVTAGFAGGIGATLGFWFRVARMKRQEGGI